MFDKILQKAEDAVNRLNQVLTLFDQDFSRLKGNYEKELQKYRDQAELQIRAINVDIDNIFSGTLSKTQGVQEKSDKVIEGLKTKIDAVVTAKFEEFSAAGVDRLNSLRKTAEDSTESLRQVLVDQYAKMEEKARNDAQKAFEQDLEQIFVKYNDKLAPLIFKSFLKGLIRIILRKK